MKILMITSRESTIVHGSGEVESYILKLGFQLLGHKCDFIGVESLDFKNYDAYFLFSMRDDVLAYVDHIAKNKYCVIFPHKHSFIKLSDL